MNRVSNSPPSGGFVSISSLIFIFRGGPCRLAQESRRNFPNRIIFDERNFYGIPDLGLILEFNRVPVLLHCSPETPSAKIACRSLTWAFQSTILFLSSRLLPEADQE